MMQHKEFSVPFSGLKQGKHEFKFEVDNSFFESFGYEEFNAAAITLHLELDKRSTMLELELRAEGTVNVDCDLSREPYDQPIDASLELVVKFGEEYNDEDDEILIIPHGEHQINIAQYAYEMMVLAVPAKRIHPKVEDGSMKSELLEKLEELQPKETKENKEDTDPRWDALKNFLTDK
ncbi:DUF177 domain-containing protein [Zeaxanthinibacter sp. PT1]|uniref:YceD family protein n=1 Tax=Zeaxanthinibacter TaxID=561554 RepID=UPI002349B902|nr:DUF177 domain-containing protein [Zeaxanthinibacter sp. PT1]MDC6350811.1 DUF177 domain-containing protein [Zeaxanthinibacter sp. PT1]